MIRVVLSGLFYPMAILRFFERAFQRRDDVELITIGPYTGTWIPWNGGMDLNKKYDKPPTKSLHRGFPTGFSPESITPPGQIDLWVQCDAGFFFGERPKADIVAHIATDPHVLDYSKQRLLCDYFFNMQAYYMQGNDIYLPYAYDPTVHYHERKMKLYDSGIMGLQYPERVALANMLKSKGYSVFSGIGPVFDEYRDIYNKSRTAFSISSRNDLIARVFEVMAMKVPLVTNRVPDLPKFFEEDVHYLAFDQIQGAALQIEWLLHNPAEANDMAEAAYEAVKPHTYDARVQQILETVGLINE